jgi:hypothetical protein
MSGPINKKHELSVMNIFMSRLRKAAEREGKRLICAPLDGQDAWLGADCLMSEGSRFAMAEFKYEKPDIRSENRKPHRLAMCKALLGDSTRLHEHEACHLIAWSVRDEKRTIVFNGYSNEVCNAKIWGDQHGLRNTIDPGPRQEDELFVEAFLSGDVGLEFADFEAYVAWLSQFEGSGSNDIELLIENPDEDAFGALHFTSLGELKQWMDNNPPRTKPPSASPRSGPGSSFGPQGG